MRVIIENLQVNQSEYPDGYYQTLQFKEEIRNQQKLSDLKPIDISLYYKTKEERKALKTAKKDAYVYSLAHPSDGNVIRVQTCGGNPHYRGYTLEQLMKEY